MEKLNVFFNQNLVGVLNLDSNRLFSFSYSGKWLEAPDSFPLSISLPLVDEMFPDDKVKPFFANLLPESAVRNLIARRLGVSEKNDFLLLKFLGGECAGAITILPESILPEKNDQYRYRLLSEEQMADLIQNIPKRPLLAGEEGIRISLAGAQEKLALFYKNTLFYIPLNGAPSNCILKPGMVHFKSSIENECFCMMLAGSLNLRVPSVEIIEKKSNKVLLIQRYDRFFHNDAVIRLHQEDFCQAMGLSHELKYQADGGPGLKECFDLVRKYSANPVKDMQQLLRWVFFNYLIGNMDAHAKNLSFLYHMKQIRLAPFYDMLCTNIYEELSQKLAMKIGKENRLEWIMERHWEKFAVEINIRPVVVKKQLAGFCHKMINQVEKIYTDFSDEYEKNELVQDIITAIRRRAGRTLDVLK
ncbi:MAG: type II toxin-antitoxin system HipA family toxin [Desulfobacterales bacterium]|nr:type II toxin-antitoxin system HipA family toxin [Desulfobacterales bacterium]MDD4072199.1 type II toxin-antitoxin system HipA family toxin [Desulfobacterales bacterium]MDD4393074.1 type II toxin-antitoxin system HipA family toxin [Desulfobacterales bacterium]